MRCHVDYLRNMNTTRCNSNVHLPLLYWLMKFTLRNREYVFVLFKTARFSCSSVLYIAGCPHDITVIHCYSLYSDSVRLQELLNFIINCTLQSNELECVVDGPTAVLPNNTTCQINNEPPMKCELSL